MFWKDCGMKEEKYYLWMDEVDEFVLEGRFFVFYFVLIYYLGFISREKDFELGVRRFNFC